jgi:hypothetical protein
MVMMKKVELLRQSVSGGLECMRGITASTIPGEKQ